MATGIGNKRTKQTGEALAVAELGRNGWIAASFSGNVPDFDIIASNENYETIFVQVKASNGQSWQLNADKFVAIEMDTLNKKQIIKGKKPIPEGKIYYFFIMLNGTGKDDFYIIPQKELQNIIFDKYNKEIGEEKGGKRPKNWENTHWAIKPEEIMKFKDKWEILNR